MSLMLTAAAALAACGGVPVTNCIDNALSALIPTATPTELLIDGDDGKLAGTLIDNDPQAPALLLLPGSGPTDRNGDNPLGVKGRVYAQLADGLRQRGIASLRIDKRGMGASKTNGDPNAVTIAAYVSDAARWRDQLIARGHRCVWLAGHSEGGLIALAMAAQQPGELCGVILIAAPGRRLDAILKDQLSSKLPAAMMVPTSAAIDRLARGEKVDQATLPEGVRPLFAPQVQGYLIDMMRQDPAALAARIKLPMLIIQGDSDIQVALADAKMLKAAQPAASLVVLDGTNHVLKPVGTSDIAGNVASYGNAELLIDSRVASTIANFITLKR